LWKEGPSSFHGKHFNFGPALSYPKPAQRDGIPIHIGGHSPAAARRAGRLGDGFFPALGDIPKLKELFDLMREEAAKHGRNADAIELSSMGRANLDAFKGLRDIGISRVVIPPPGNDKEKLSAGLEKLGNEVIAKL
jgi:hypothetical protein